MNTFLNTYGFTKSFIESVNPEILKQHEIARVTAVHKDSYTVTNGEKEIPAELNGKLAFNASSSIDYPVVGDWVLANYYDDDTLSIIYEILMRKSLLKRKTPGKKTDFQMIAANIDTAFIVQSLNENFNIRRLERYLVMCNESNIRPVVLLSKSDVVSPQEVAGKMEEIKQQMVDLKVVNYSSETEEGLDRVRALLEPALTYCLLGSSGVGKTTLINKLVGKSLFATKAISKKGGKGRHATTHRQLIKLAEGALIVDTPGMRELGNFSVEKGLDETFSEITDLSATCYFNDCTHVNEKGCAVLGAISQGKLSPERFQNYLKMNKESHFYEMSYVEKRNKDKQFGKMVKAVMKQKKQKR